MPEASMLATNDNQNASISINVLGSIDCFTKVLPLHIEGFVKDCSNSSELAMDLMQSCIKPSIYSSVPL